MTATEQTPIATLDDIDYERARRAYLNVSFSPEERAKRVQQEYIEDVTQLYQHYAPYATSDTLRMALLENIERYQRRYVELMHAILDARSRTASPMITGPANFPVARNHKRMETEQKRIEEFTAWRDKAHKAIHRLFVPETELVISSDDPDAPSKLQAKLEIARTEHAAMVEANKAARKAKEPLLYGGYQLQNSNARIKSIEIRIKNLAQTAATEAAFEEVIGEGWRLYAEDNRICIAFDERQSAEMTAQLKSNAFKWSPTRRAWVRQFTTNAVYAAKQLLGLN